jgi:hypothetical protein
MPVRSPAAWPDLRTRVLAFIERGWDAHTPNDVFDDCARAVFSFQFEHNAPYRAWCESRGRSPDRLDHWTAIPVVPTAAFREVALVCGPPEGAEAVFRTSGTTLGGGRRGTHHVRDLSLYHAALRATFRGLVLPDDAHLAMLSLLPPSSALADSSLAHMVGDIVRTFGTDNSGHFATLDAGLDVAALDQSLRACEARRQPVCILGTSLSFVHWMDALRESDRRYDLPDGSRLMDTGGFKGRSRVVPEEELRATYIDRLGIPGASCINEYGMTELTSQFYDSTLCDHWVGAGDRARRKRGPAWVRTRVVDPDTLEPLPDGHTGLLQHFDVANAGSVLAIQTEDLGVIVQDGFRVLRRASGAPPRGCSIAMDELLVAAKARP